MRSEGERGGVRVGGAEYGLSAVAKEATREKLTRLGFELRVVVVVLLLLLLMTSHCDL